MGKSGRFTSLVAGLTLIVGLSACSADVSVGGDSSQTPTATAEQSVPSDVKTYTSDKYGFSFQYAPPFEMKDDTSFEAEGGASSADSVGVFDTEGTQVDGQYRDAFLVNTYELNTEITADKLEAVKAELEQNVIPQLEQSSEAMQISELTPTTVNGVNGYQADATFAVGNTPITSRLYFLFDGMIEYQLLTQSATDRWTELSPTLEEMVDSFTVSDTAAVTPAS